MELIVLVGILVLISFIAMSISENKQKLHELKTSCIRHNWETINDGTEYAYMRCKKCYLMPKHGSNDHSDENN